MKKDTALKKRVSWIQEQIGVENAAAVLTYHTSHFPSVPFLEATTPADSKRLMEGFGNNYLPYHLSLCAYVEGRFKNPVKTQHMVHNATKPMSVAGLADVGKNLFEGAKPGEMWAKPSPYENAKWYPKATNISLLLGFKDLLRKFGEETVTSAFALFPNFYSDYDKDDRPILDSSVVKMHHFLGRLTPDETDRVDILANLKQLRGKGACALNKIIEEVDVLFEENAANRRTHSRISDLASLTWNAKIDISDKFQERFIDELFPMEDDAEYRDIYLALTGINSIPHVLSSPNKIGRDYKVRFLTRYMKAVPVVREKFPDINPLLLGDVYGISQIKSRRHLAAKYYGFAVDFLSQTTPDLREKFSQLFRAKGHTYYFLRDLLEFGPKAYQKMNQEGISSDDVEKAFGLMVKGARLGVEPAGALMIGIPYLMKDDASWEATCENLLQEERSERAANRGKNLESYTSHVAKGMKELTGTNYYYDASCWGTRRTISTPDNWIHSESSR